MKITGPYIFIVFVVFCFGTFNVSGQDAVELLKNMDDLMLSPKDKQGNVKIILTNKQGKEKIREATMKQKGSDYRLYRYTQPESQAGIATLSIPDGIMWLYMPAFKKPKKITLLAKSQAFTGTDFSYEDMEAKSYSERFIPELIATTDETYQLNLIPISEKSDYSKIILTIDKTNYYPVLMEYFKKDRKIKEATYKYQKVGNYWNAEEVIMTDLKKNHSTKIVLTDVVFDQGLTEEDFTLESLVAEKED
jgi:outer membrane lipoprotein-sorting protein